MVNGDELIGTTEYLTSW